jgi:hypothetical protein
MMKKTLFAALTAVFLLNSCKKNDVPLPEITNVSTARKALVMDFTGLQCGICTSMLPRWNNLLNSNKNKAIGFSVHCGVGDTLNNNFSLWFANDFNVAGTPSWAEGTNMMTLSTFEVMETSMNATIANKADLGIGLKKTLSGTTISITTKTVLFKDMSGEYNIALYVVEDGCVADQTGTPMTHNHVLRGSANGRYGSLLFSGSKSKGEIIDQTFTYNIGVQGDDYWNAANLHVVAVVYRMDAGTAKEVINCNAE